MFSLQLPFHRTARQCQYGTGDDVQKLAGRLITSGLPVAYGPGSPSAVALQRTKAPAELIIFTNNEISSRDEGSARRETAARAKGVPGSGALTQPTFPLAFVSQQFFLCMWVFLRLIFLHSYVFFFIFPRNLSAFLQHYCHHAPVVPFRLGTTFTLLLANKARSHGIRKSYNLRTRLKTLFDGVYSMHVGKLNFFFALSSH